VSNETERVRAIWDKMAPRYDSDIAFFERVLFGGGREWVCSQAQGEVLEVAVGTGRNLALYQPGARLTAIDFSPAMLALARERARQVHPDADLRVGDAQALEFADETFDTVVITLALCSIPDDRRAVAEAWRVMRPGGRLLLLEHGRSRSLPVRAVQRVIDFFTVRFEGDHMVREPVEHLRAVGFKVDRLERSKLGIVERVAAIKPAVTTTAP
jgi:ubiquinone/menaquinone biosynthesis C-methylase UbiE